jgi:hypothetical protein
LRESLFHLAIGLSRIAYGLDADGRIPMRLSVPDKAATSRRLFKRRQYSRARALSHGEIDPIEIVKESLFDL